MVPQSELWLPIYAAPGSGTLLQGLLLLQGPPLPPTPLVSGFQDNAVALAAGFVLCYARIQFSWRARKARRLARKRFLLQRALPSSDENSLNDRKPGIEQDSGFFQAKTPPGWVSADVPPEASQVFSMNTSQTFDSVAQTTFTTRGLI